MAHSASFAFPDLVSRGDAVDGLSPLNDDERNQQHLMMDVALTEMECTGSDEEDGPTPVSNFDSNVNPNGNALNLSKHKPSVHEADREPATFRQWDEQTQKMRGKRSKSAVENRNRILVKREDSFDGFNRNGPERVDEKDCNGHFESIRDRIYSKDDMHTVGLDEEGKDGAVLNKRMKRVASDQSELSKQYGFRRNPKQIIVLPTTKMKVKSPPQIHNKTEFRQLIRPTMSADVVALNRKKNMMQ